MNLPNKLFTLGVAFFFIAILIYGIAFPGRNFLRNYINATVANLIVTNQWPTPTPQPTATRQPDAWQSTIQEFENKSVLVETFDASKLVRSGTGTIVSSDGLVVTVGEIVPIGPQYVYQVRYGQTILRARLESKSASSNLALLKVEASDMNVAPIRLEGTIDYASILMLSGKFSSVSGPINFAQSGVVSYVISSGTFIDTKINWFIYGAQAILSDGTLAGIVSVRQDKVILIPSTIIDTFVKDFFANKK